MTVEVGPRGCDITVEVGPRGCDIIVEVDPQGCDITSYHILDTASARTLAVLSYLISPVNDLL